MPDIPKQRPAWLVGYGLLSPTLAIMAAMMVAPLLAMVALSFWTQQGFEIERGFTLANYFALVEPSSEPTVWMGVPFPLKYPVPAILLIKSIIMSLAVTVAVDPGRRGHPSADREHGQHPADGREGHQRAAERGLPATDRDPVRGRRSAQPHDPVRHPVRQGPRRTPAESATLTP